MFIDEIDKVTRRQETLGADVSREGVQRDLLPLVEGSTVTTKYGPVKTDHVLFIASGAFQHVQALGPDPGAAGTLADPRGARLAQGRGFRAHPHRAGRVADRAVPGALMNTEGVSVDFAASGVRRIAEIAFQVNERTENIGARRLHTVMERLLETVSYDATEQGGTSVTIDAEYVDDHLGNLVKDEDLSRYIL